MLFCVVVSKKFRVAVGRYVDDMTNVRTVRLHVPENICRRCLLSRFNLDMPLHKIAVATSSLFTSKRRHPISSKMRELPSFTICLTGNKFAHKSGTNNAGKNNSIQKTKVLAHKHGSDLKHYSLMKSRTRQSAELLPTTIRLETNWMSCTFESTKAPCSHMQCACAFSCNYKQSKCSIDSLLFQIHFDRLL